MMIDQMKMTGPWFVIVEYEDDDDTYVVSASDQQDAMKIASEQALVPGVKVYIAQALVQVQPQMLVTQLVTPIGPDLEDDAVLADSIPEPIQDAPMLEDPGPLGDGRGIEDDDG